MVNFLPNFTKERTSILSYIYKYHYNKCIEFKIKSMFSDNNAVHSLVCDGQYFVHVCNTLT